MIHVAIAALIVVVAAALGGVSGCRSHMRDLSGRLSAIRTLHQPGHIRPSHPPCCLGCGQRWPCNTERVVR